MTLLAFSRSGSLNISPRAVGMICHETPYLSLSQPHWCFSPPSESLSHSSSTSFCVSQFTNEMAGEKVNCGPPTLKFVTRFNGPRTLNRDRRPSCTDRRRLAHQLMPQRYWRMSEGRCWTQQRRPDHPGCQLPPSGNSVIKSHTGGSGSANSDFISAHVGSGVLAQPIPHLIVGIVGRRSVTYGPAGLDIGDCAI